MSYSREEIAAILNRVAQYSLEWGSGYYAGQSLEVQHGSHGEWFEIEEVLSAFGLTQEWNGTINVKVE
jgi:hypothetical protein